MEKDMRIIENIKEGNSTQKDFFFKKLQYIWNI